ncbi:MAG: hypothetical protein R2882_11280 [Gemmatimonadales bacterium]
MRRTVRHAAPVSYLPEVRRTIERYVAAINARSLTQLKAIFPTLRGDQEDRWRDLGDEIETISATSTVQGINEQGTTAEARFLVTLSFKPNAATPSRSRRSPPCRWTAGSGGSSRSEPGRADNAGPVAGETVTCGLQVHSDSMLVICKSSLLPEVSDGTGLGFASELEHEAVTTRRVGRSPIGSAGGLIRGPSRSGSSGCTSRSVAPGVARLAMEDRVELPTFAQSCTGDTAEIILALDQGVTEAAACLRSISDARYAEPWQVVHAGQVKLEMPERRSCGRSCSTSSITIAAN